MTCAAATRTSKASVIRLATAADVAAVVSLGIRFVESTVYSRLIALDPALVGAFITSLVARSDGAVLVVDVDGAIVGMLGLVAYAHPFSGEYCTSELFWYVDEAHRGAVGVRLLREAERWSRRHGATIMNVVAPTPEIEKIYTRLRYAQVETTYRKVL